MSDRDILLPSTTEGSDSDARAALPVSHRLTRARRRLAGLRQLRREQVEQLRRADEQLQSRQERLQELTSELQDHSRDLRATDPDYVRRRLHKRQKTSHSAVDPQPSGFHDFSYGTYGQSLPGSLRLDIVSCDGGEYLSDYQARSYLSPRANDYLADSYRIANVLRDDKSVYCTTSSRCNLMLRHVGESIFTLDRIVIKAPEVGYTAPIQQGLVFVGNDADELLAATESYNPRPREGGPTRGQLPRSNTHGREDDQLTLLESLHHDTVWQAHRHREQRHRLEGLRRNLEDATTELTEYFGQDFHDEHLLDRLSDAGWLRSRGWSDICEWPPLDPIRAGDVARAPTPPAFTITSDRASPDVVEDAMNATSNHEQASHAISSDTSDDEDEAILQAQAYHDDFGNMSRSRYLARFAQPEESIASTPGTIPAAAASDVATLKPNARFFIGRKKSKISIKFDPPISGRYLLLKLFSPMMKDGGNIDIQFVGAYGYAGPRFFPALSTK